MRRCWSQTLVGGVVLATFFSFVGPTGCEGYSSGADVSRRDPTTSHPPVPQTGTARTANGPGGCDPDRVDVEAMLNHMIDARMGPCELEALDLFIAMRQELAGPWDQDISVAYSPDALNFSGLKGEIAVWTAAVPEVYRGDDGRYYLYYVDADVEKMVERARAGSTWFQTHGIPVLGALNLAVSDNGIDFTPVEEFGIDGVVRGMVVDPDLIRLPDGTFRLYYTGLPLPEWFESDWEEGEQHLVFYATSSDLIHWTQQGEVFRGPYADPSIYCQPDGTCVLASFGLDWSVSRDWGRSFAYLGHWREDGFAPEFVRVDEHISRMFFNSKYGGARLYSYTSEHGRDWRRDPGERMRDTYGEAVSLATAPGGGWFMYFHTFKSSDDIPPPEPGNFPTDAYLGF